MTGTWLPELIASPRLVRWSAEAAGKTASEVMRIPMMRFVATAERMAFVAVDVTGVVPVAAVVILHLSGREAMFWECWLCDIVWPSRSK